MKGKEIQIDRLNIILPKGSKLYARQIAKGLPSEILSQISDLPNTEMGSARIEKLDAGKLKISGKRSVEGLQSQIARNVVSEISKSLNNRGEK